MTIFFDLSMAFDIIDVKFVTEKIGALGLRGNVKNWLMSYLSGRTFQVKVDNY